MNRIYKLKFDKRRNELVVVSEITAGMGKEKSTGHIADLPALSPFRKLLGTLTPVSLLTGLISGLLPAMVLAADLPTGGQIVGGQGSISTSGNQMTIHQQTQNMATNWHSFDIGKNNTVQFVQPDSSSVALNRVTGASGSQIMGTLKANGQVFILNPNGVLFGKNARVDVGGLVASTKNISTADFMKGQYTLSGEGNPGAQVINQGSLTTSKGGYIVLAGERVSNSGTVTTPGGKTVLAAGKTVTLQLDNGGLTSVSVNGSVVNALVENRGLISASNGQVYLTAKGQDMLLNTVVNNSGTVEAKGLVSRAGEIVLDGGDSGVVSQSGQLLADSQTGQGGKITLEGQNIHLAGGSLTSATGKTGGGEVYVGGGWQGKDSRIRNASKVVMDKTATVDVSATEAGNGGTAVLWSDDYTNFRGTVLAKGGSQSGNGGRVETSSHRNLQASGTVDASSPSGKGGEWLLDPTDVTIVGSGADSNIDATTNAGIFTPTASGARILNTSIVSQLNAGTNVTVKTSGTDTGGQTGNITLNADIVKTAGADTKLTLLADNNIATAGNVSIGATTGKLNLDLLAGNITDNASVVLGRNINISLNGGDFYAGPGNTTNNISLQYSNNGKIAAGNITMNVTRGLTGYAASAIADNDLTINGTVSMTTGWGVNSQLAAGGVLSVNSPGAISLTAVDRANGGAKVTIKGDEGVNLNSGTGINLSAATTNNVSISSDKGDITLKASNGSVLISGADSSAKVNITSVLGGVTISGESASSYGVKIKNANISAVNGVIHISGIGSILAGQNDQSGSVTLGGNIVTNAREVNISGNNLGRSNSYFPVAGVYLGDSGLINWDMYGGDVNVYGEAKNGAGVIFGVQTSNNKNILNVHASSLSITGCTSATSIPSGIGVAGVYTSSYVGRSSGANFTLYNNADVYIFGDASRASNKVQGLSTNTVMDGDGSQGFAFSGNGNVYLHGISNDGDGVKLDVINNKFLTGNITIRGESNSGTGVYYGREPDIELVNAIVNGSSNSGTGLLMISGAAGSKFDLNGNVLTGGSETGNGVSISGSNVTITNGTLTGKAMTGSGSGVVLTGNSNYMFDNMSVTGTAVDGSGISVNGTLTVNNGSQFMGKAIGSGDGVTISGKLITSIGDGIIINGEASSGDGIKVSGDTTLTNVTLKGQTDAGNGVSIVGNLTADKASQVMGQATAQGTGVSVSGTVIGGKVDGTATSGDAVRVTDGGVLTNAVVTGNASTGTGLNVSGNATLTNATLSGETQTGSGAVVTGKLTITDGVSGVTAKATGNGTGLLMENATLQANGYVGPDKAHAIVATAEGAGGTAIKIQGDNHLGYVPITGNAFSVGGTGVSLGGQVSFANIKGVADRGTAVAVADGTVLDGGAVHGRSDNGTGLAADGNVTLNGALISGSVQGSGTGVSLKGNITGGTVTGISVSSGDAVQIVDSRLTDTEVKGDSQTGAGVKTQGNVTLQGTELSATSEHGITDLDVSGALNRDQYSVISADRIAGQENIHVFQPDTPPSPEEGGATGSGGNTTPDTGDSGGVAGGDTGSGESGGTVTPPSGGTGGDAGNNGNTGSTAGSEGSIPDNNAAQPGGAPGPAIREQILVSALRQQAVDAQVTRMNQATPDGFHSAATPVVPVTGYQAKPQNVEINLCDEESCQPEALDAAMPAEGVVTSSGK
ncbi:filamentous hemagglutinin N-terminal domain-containing protein [Salmonella enterica]|nr:filamentous hemagglutinin N-terminal domain-containing protein [Salmonella enterica]